MKAEGRNPESGVCLQSEESALHPSHFVLRPVHEKRYICPGETHAISRSVHLARLAAGFAVCRECPLSEDTGLLPARSVRRLTQSSRCVPRKSLLTHEGVRGIHQNEITRQTAARWAAAFAGLLWRGDSSSVAHDTVDRITGTRRRRPKVVVGYDERPSSPDPFVGVVRALEEMGCLVVDVRMTTRPCFWFAVDHLQATAGVYVTGAGCDPAWTGLEFVGPDATPISTVKAYDTSDGVVGDGEGLSLKRLEESLRSTPARPTRRGGEYRTFQASIPYQSGLWKHFHGLRPLTIVCGTPSRIVREMLTGMLEKFPCRLHTIDLPRRVRDFGDETDPDLRSIREAVAAERAHLGVLIEEDGQRCLLFDETGERVSSRDTARLICEAVALGEPNAAICVERDTFEDLAPQLEGMGLRCLDAGSAQAEMSRAMRAARAAVGVGDSDRFWFRESFPTSDAITASAYVLEALSRSDGELSQRSTKDEGRSQKSEG